MKTVRLNQLILACFLWLGSQGALEAQSYSMNWHLVAGGGGVSSDSQYSVRGAIGQHDAGGALTGDGYSLTGGFWAVVQTAGLPSLTIAHAGNKVIISWPNTGNYTLQQNSHLNESAAWATSSYSISSSNGTNSITITSPAGNLFFRLANP